MAQGLLVLPPPPHAHHHVMVSSSLSSSLSRHVAEDLPAAHTGQVERSRGYLLRPHAHRTHTPRCSLSASPISNLKNLLPAACCRGGGGGKGGGGAKS